MARLRMGPWALAVAGAVVLTGCADGDGFAMFKKKDTGAETGRAATDTAAVRLVDRDVEAPEVFQVTEQGLWDGRPSLGGVWVAYPEVKDPERVIIRNEANGKFVIGALFRRERENPGPKLQVSSDAAAALGLLAGAPERLNVTALRREEVAISEETTAGSEPALEAPEEIQTASLDPVAATAGAAIGAAEQKTATDAAPPAEAVASTAPAPAAAPPRSSALDRPYIQIGLFSMQENAERTGNQLRSAGVVPIVEPNESRGKKYYRVLVGPAATAGERTALLEKVKSLGFADAYLVRN